MAKRRARPISADTKYHLQKRLETESHRQVALAANVSRDTLTRALAGDPVSAATERRLASPRVKTASDYTAGGAEAAKAPRRMPGATAFSSKDDALLWIRNARDNQIAGQFQRPVQLATMMRTDGALYNAYHNRVAPQTALACDLVGHDTQAGRAVTAKARQQIVAPREVLAGIAGTLANHAIAIGKIEKVRSPTSVSFRLSEWPLEYVRYNESTDQLETATQDHGIVPIVHGDSTWVRFESFGLYPWIQNAAVIPGAFLYAAHAEGLADMSGAARSHGLAKVLGTLPQGVALRDSEGELTPEAEAYLQMLVDLIAGGEQAGIQAFGGKTEVLANGSTAWQIFESLLTQTEKLANRIYLGTDAYLGSTGGAPGVDISQLFGIASTKIQGDVSAIEEGLYTGVCVPWTAINTGDSRLAPRYKYQLPDPDAAAKQAQTATAYEAFNKTVAELRTNGFVIDQGLVAKLAKQLGIDPPLLVA